jgi:hypothetical protein
MKKALIAATAVATLWGGVALAQDDTSADNPDSQTETQQEGTTVRTPSTSQATPDSWRDRTLPDQQTGVGGSGTATVQTAPPALGVQQLQCQCRDLSTGTGGSGIIQTTPSNPSAPSSNGYQSLPNGASGDQGVNPEGTEDEGTNVDGSHTQELNRSEGQGTGGSGDTVVVGQAYEPPGPDLSGVTVLLGGGVEGYTGALAPRVGVGPTYGAAIQLRPAPMFGLELAYSGGVHEIKDNLTHGANVASGADIVRNGARAMLSLGLPTPVQPYITGGVGVNWYSVRGNANAFGFRDDTAGEVPLGAGIRTQVGAFTADLRGLYDVPFSQDFAPGETTTSTNAQVATFKTQNDGRYQGTLSIGATF